MQNNARKNIIYSIVLLLVLFGVFLYRQNQESPVEAAIESDRVTVTGKTMGTTYRVVYMDDQRRDFKVSIDSLLVEFNQSLSTYIPESELSRFNQRDSLMFESSYLLPVLKKSQEVYNISGGAFDPTVGPLVNAWGFGPSGPQPKDSVDIRKLLPLVGFDKVHFDEKLVWKSQPGIYVDFSAIAKGYAVDIVAGLLDERGISNMLVGIGGELVARGGNDKGEVWDGGVKERDAR